jgi:hypothetical protein
MTHIAIFGAAITGVAIACAPHERGGHGHLGWSLSTAQIIAVTIDGWRRLNAPVAAPSLGVEHELRHAS